MAGGRDGLDQAARLEARRWQADAPVSGYSHESGRFGPCARTGIRSSAAASSTSIAALRSRRSAASGGGVHGVFDGGGSSGGYLPDHGSGAYRLAELEPIRDAVLDGLRWHERNERQRPPLAMRANVATAGLRRITGSGDGGSATAPPSSPSDANAPVRLSRTAAKPAAHSRPRARYEHGGELPDRQRVKARSCSAATRTGPPRLLCARGDRAHHRPKSDDSGA
jgi:hypothetical protein